MLRGKGNIFLTFTRQGGKTFLNGEAVNYERGMTDILQRGDRHRREGDKYLQKKIVKYLAGQLDVVGHQLDRQRKIVMY